MSIRLPRRLLRRIADFAPLALLVLVLARAPARAAAAPLQAPPAAEQDAQPVFDSPRAVVEGFLAVYAYESSHDPADLARAAATLDVEGPLVARRQKAETAVQRLGKVFDHVALVDPARVQRELVVLDDARARWSVSPASDPQVVIALGFAKLADGWRIDRETVAQIDGWYAQVEDLPRIAEAEGKPMSANELVRSFVPRKLKGGGFLLEPWQWIGLLILFLVAFFAERIITLFVRPLIRKLSRFEGVNVEPTYLARFERPFGWLLLGWLFLGGVQILDLPTNVYAPLRIAIGLFTTVLTVWAAYTLVDIACWPLQVKADKSENKFDDMLVPLLRRTLKMVVVLVGFIFVLSSLTGDVMHVLAGLSIGSLAIGFAAKDSIENLFGTFTVLLDGPFQIGDVVKVGDIEGVVEAVGFRSTRIRTPEDSVISVPNSRFIGSHVDNLGQRRQRRIRIVYGLTYDTPPEKVEAFCEGVRELVRKHPHTRKDNYHVWLANLGASSLDVELVCFVALADHATFLRERHRLYLDVLRLAARLRISFAFPTQTVWQAQPDEAQHADAPKDSLSAIARGRAAGAELGTATSTALGGKPAPVRFDPEDPDTILR